MTAYEQVFNAELGERLKKVNCPSEIFLFVCQLKSSGTLNAALQITTESAINSPFSEYLELFEICKSGKTEINMQQAFNAVQICLIPSYIGYLGCKESVFAGGYPEYLDLRKAMHECMAVWQKFAQPHINAVQQSINSTLERAQIAADIKKGINVPLGKFH